MTAELFKKRTKNLALRCGEFVDQLPIRKSLDIYGRQLIRSSSSVGANYWAVCRAKSQADMINKLKIVEEADETLYWLELIEESSHITNNELLNFLKKEADEILSMVISSIKTLRAKNKNL
ncbi:MAG: four helix bundle protein [Bacteroidetes bacterium]|nr:four helix bundle protein [Bacteroidota bacterium]